MLLLLSIGVTQGNSGSYYKAAQSFNTMGYGCQVSNHCLIIVSYFSPSQNMCIQFCSFVVIITTDVWIIPSPETIPSFQVKVFLNRT